MKGILPLSPICGIFCVLVTGCGSLSHRSEDAAKKGFVSRAEYENLKWRHQKLLRETGRKDSSLKDKKAAGKETYKLPSGEKAPELAETVDVFSSVRNISASPGMGSKSPELPEDVARQVEIFQRAQDLFRQNQLGASLTELKKIEGSRIKQVRAHVHFLTGEIMFQQQEYDVAAQMYKEVLSQEAFSGLVLNSLKRLIVCSEKLDLPDEKQRYQAILNSFMES